MPSFITRVELHGGSAEDYQALNTAMEAGGFSRIIQGEGAASILPPGQYIGIGEVAAGDVLQFAQRAALTTKKGYAIFVSDFTTAAWFGLDASQPPVAAN